MIDRLVCADGGNPDPTRPTARKPAKAKALELAGWAYPKHLAGRVYGGGRARRRRGHRRRRAARCRDWLDWMGLIDAGVQARLDRYIGYYEPYATSHDALDADARCRTRCATCARAWLQRGGGAARRARCCNREAA